MRQAELDRLNAGCVRIDGSNGPIGTGFLVSDRQIVTCYHVVRGRENSTLKFYQKGGGQSAEVAKMTQISAIVAEIKFDETLDCAILALEKPLSLTPLTLSTGEYPESSEWSSFGFPSFQQFGFDCKGEFRNRKAVDDKGVAALQLYCVDLAAGEGQPLNGLSGAPIVCGGVVVGHVRKGISDKRFLPTNPAAEGEYSAVGGIIYAAPVFAALKLLGRDTAMAAENLIKKSVSEEARRTDKIIKGLGGDLHAIDDYADQCIRWRYVYGLLKVREHQLTVSLEKGIEQYAWALAQQGHAFYMVNDPQAEQTWSNAEAIFKQSNSSSDLEHFQKGKETTKSLTRGWLLPPP